MNRRHFIGQTIVLAAALAHGGGLAAKAQTQDPQSGSGHRQAGYYWHKVGDVDVVALSDGTLRSTAKLLSATPDQVEALLKASYVPSPRVISVNAFLIIHGERRILVDAGTGTLLGPTLNKLPGSLGAAGFKPEQITDILLTHIHGDHSGGLTVDGKRVFPLATVHVNRVEADFWLDPANMDKVGAYFKPMFAFAKASLAPYVAAGKVAPFEAGAAVLPGVSTQAAPGHTPGHSFYILDSQGERLVFLGDIIHVAEVQFPRPDVAIEYDLDPDAAIKQREQAFFEAASQGHLVAGAHISFPGIGHVGKANPGYRWLAVPYVNDARGLQQT